MGSADCLGKDHGNINALRQKKNKGNIKIKRNKSLLAKCITGTSLASEDGFCWDW